jgi:hypothetical protein
MAMNTGSVRPFALELMDRTVRGHVHFPHDGAVAKHAVVLVPGGLGSGGGFDDPGAPVTADDLAALGFAGVHFDPSGRGESSGPEDYWGLRHQEDLRAVLDHVLYGGPAPAETAGVLSFSMGITIAAGALAGYRGISRVRYLYDWEGPSNRRVTTLNDTMPMFQNMPTSDDRFWETREANKFISAIPCGYFRYQCEEDHVQGKDKGHAVELLNLATAGRAVWTRCNDNPVDTVFDEERLGDYHWVDRESDRKSGILGYLLDVQRLCTRS